MTPRRPVSRRNVLRATALAGVGALVAACGAPQATTQTEPTNEAAAAGAAAATQAPAVLRPVGTNAWAYDSNVTVNNAQPIKLSMWSADDKYTKFFKHWTTVYTALHPNVTFDIQFTPWGDYWTKLPLAIPAGQGPDIFHFHNAYTLPFVEGSLIEPWPEAWIPALKEDFYQIDTHLINDKLYYFDNGTMTGAVYYNTQLWTEAGLADADIPTTWEQFVAVAKKLTKRDADGRITVEGFGLNGMPMHLYPALIHQDGEYLFTEGGKAVNAGDAQKKAIAFMSDAYYGAEPISSPEFPDFTESFGNGQSAMVYAWGWVNNFIKSNYPTIEFSAFRTPTWSGDVSPAIDRNIGDATWSVNAMAKPEAKEVAFDFLHFVYDNQDAAIETALMTAQAPVMKRIADDPQLKDDLVTSLSMSVMPRTVYAGVYPADWETILQKYLHDGLKNKLSVEEIAQGIKDEGDAAIQQATAIYWDRERLYPYNAEMNGN